MHPALETLEGRPLLANAGLLDPTFGASGKVFTPLVPALPEAIGLDAAAGVTVHGVFPPHISDRLLMGR